MREAPVSLKGGQEHAPAGFHRHSVETGPGGVRVYHAIRGRDAPRHPRKIVEDKGQVGVGVKSVPGAQPVVVGP